MLLENKVAVVTGSSRGIGRAIALELAGAGADVAINCTSKTCEAENVKQEIEDMGRRAAVIQGDISDPEFVNSMVKKVNNELGKASILVNNAGINRDNLLMRMKDEEWDDVLRVNLKGAFLCARAFSRDMLKSRSGRIINVSSVVGLTGNPGQANYCSAKAGLIGMSKSIARELGSRNITVNCVAPGFISTDMTQDLPEDKKDEMMKQIPLSQLGTPGDVASLVAFLASDAARYISGQVIAVDGGMTM
ncbi:MAG: 3-oxoacyl-[acyl-carrier-protein] reductase [Clostridiales bacterium]|nr:3-oxoacyl-[acyl-carrier-protein] reductase [Clostridiales bacterium]MCF8022593.1 3-oxoacyl-[acyl-carrier-protein] reductase [Clostridiales bacterium]